MSWTRPTGTYTSFQIRHRKSITETWTTSSASRTSVSKVISGLTCNTLYQVGIRTTRGLQGGGVTQNSSWVPAYGRTSACSAVRVGTLTRFGNSAITAPAGLAWDGRNLYMVDDATDALYRINRTTGRATRVNSFTSQFGLSITNPRGLAWSQADSLLLLTPTSVYKLNKSTGAATRFVDSTTQDPFSNAPTPTPAAFGTDITNANGIAAHGRRILMVDSTRDALYVIDRSRGIASKAGNLTNSKGASITDPSGLAMVGTDLYVSSTNPNTIYKINRDTGTATWSKSLTLSTVTGLSWDGSRMYAIDDSTDALYTIPGIHANVSNLSGSYLPSSGDLYYNGDVVPQARQRRYTFADSVFRWDNPSWESDDNTGNDVCNDRHPVTNCSTYEHDLYLAKNWTRGDICMTWTDLPNSYDDCATAGVGDRGGKYAFAFGTYEAPAIQRRRDYYGFWTFSTVRGPWTPNANTTTVSLVGQEGYYGTQNVYVLIPIVNILQRIQICPRKTVWCIFGSQHAALIPEGTTTWVRGTASYSTFKR